jgi:hypothetical protein
MYKFCNSYLRIRCLVAFVFESTWFRLVYSSQSQAHPLKRTRQRRSTHFVDQLSANIKTNKLRGPQYGTINVRNWRTIANISYIHSRLEASTDHLGFRIARVSRGAACSARAPCSSLSCASCRPPSASIAPPNFGCSDSDSQQPPEALYGLFSSLARAFRSGK